MRRAGAGALAVLAASLLLAGAASLWTQARILDSEEFAAAAGDALAEPTVRELLAAEITERVLEGAPVGPAEQARVEAEIEAVVGAPAFVATFEAAVFELHQALMTGSTDRFVLDLSSAAPAVTEAAERADPRLTGRVPTDGLAAVDAGEEGGLPSLEPVDRATGVVGVAGLLGGLAALAIAVAVDPRRGRPLLVAGVALAAGALVMVLVATAAPGAVAGRIDDRGVRDAVEAILAELLGGLRVTALGLVALGAATAALGWAWARHRRTAVLVG